MTEAERQAILSSAKTFFRTRIAENHKANTEKLTSLSKFNINPFTHKYLAQFAFGDSSPESMAKALIYPRVLGTSISTTFGTQLQYFCNEVLMKFSSILSSLMFVVDDFNALIQPGIIVQKQVLVILCFGKRTIVIFLVRLAVLADKSDYP